MRLESHGFINGFPVEWKIKNNEYNLNKDVYEIRADEKNRLLQVLNDKVLTIVSTVANDNTTTEQTDNILIEKEIKIFTALTEEETAAVYGLEYTRLATLDHYRPDNKVIDEFVELIKNNPDTWLHFHCHAGKGRTTTFMAMYGMFYNAKDVKLEKILVRQAAIGGEDLMGHLTKPSTDERKRKFAEERFELLKNFYKYCKNSDPRIVLWQEWLQTKS